MANEAQCIEKPTIIKNRICADANAIPKGTIVYMTDGNIVVASSAADQPFAGITIEEKVALDGVTVVGCALDGIWDITTTNAAIDVGAAAAIGGANLIVAADAADILNGAFLGYVEEACVGTEVIRVALRGY
jgi:hypothetical protein